MKDFYPFALIFVPVLAAIGLVAWALRLWIGRQKDAIQARCRVAQVIFGLVIVISMIAQFGQVWSFLMSRSPTWFPHPSLLIALATTGLICSNAHKRMKTMTP